MKPLGHRPPTPFEAYLIETRRISWPVANNIAKNAKSLLRAAPAEEVLAGDLDEIVERHPRHVRALEEHKKAWQVRGKLKGGGLALREYVAAGGEVPA